MNKKKTLRLNSSSWAVEALCQGHSWQAENRLEISPHFVLSKMCPFQPQSTHPYSVAMVTHYLNVTLFGVASASKTKPNLMLPSQWFISQSFQSRIFFFFDLMMSKKFFGSSPEQYSVFILVILINRLMQTSWVLTFLPRAREDYHSPSFRSRSLNEVQERFSKIYQQVVLFSWHKISWHDISF